MRASPSHRTQKGSRNSAPALPPEGRFSLEVQRGWHSEGMVGIKWRLGVGVVNCVAPSGERRVAAHSSFRGLCA